MRPRWFALSLLLAFAGCDSKTPEAPPEGGANEASPKADAAATPQPEAAADAATAGAEAAPEADAGATAEAPDDAAEAPEEVAEAGPPPPWDVEATGVQPLPEEVKEAFWSTPEDPPTEEFMGVDDAHVGKRYLQGDEYATFLFHEHIEDRAKGGIYVGVGSDQAYLFVGWSKPDLAFLMDYDPWVVAYHKVFLAFFEASETPEAFLALWEDEEKGVALIEEVYAEDEQKSLLLKLYDKQHSRTLSRFRHYKTFDVPTFVDDAEQYAFVRAMVMAERIRPISANLLATKGLKGIGDFAKAQNLPVRIFYTSNAEQYWNYSEQFRDNVRNLPFDEKSYMMKTMGSFSHNKDYRYYLQPIDNFIQWMDQKKIYKAWCKSADGCSFYRMIDKSVGRRKLSGEGDHDIQVITKTP